MKYSIEIEDSQIRMNVLSFSYNIGTIINGDIRLGTSYLSDSEPTFENVSKVIDSRIEELGLVEFVTRYSQESI